MNILLMKKNLLLLCGLFSLEAAAQNEITWDAGVNIAASSFGNEHPRIATDGNGNPLVLWHHAGSAMFSRWDGMGFTVPVALNPLPLAIAGAGWMGPDIAAKGDTVYVVFKQTPEASDTCHIYCVHSFDGGSSFSAPVQVDDFVGGISRFPTLTTDGLGNPLIGIMKFNASFGESRWVVSKSTDFGSTFSTDVLASGWSSATSDICDCCPGSIVCSGSTVAMLYRDNNSNIRDTWVGLSSDTGTSFTEGMGVNQQNWMITACPGSGPDGVIIGDTLYSVAMNGASGMSAVHYSKSSLTEATGGAGTPITGSLSGLTLQNFPRISASGNALAVVWKQVVDGTTACALRFTNEITTGLGEAFEVVDFDNITNTDVAVTDGSVFVVWQDDASGTVKFRGGTFSPSTLSVGESVHNHALIYPNPFSSQTTLQTDVLLQQASLTVYNAFGQVVREMTGLSGHTVQFDRENLPSGLYFVQLVQGNKKIAVDEWVITD